MPNEQGQGNKKPPTVTPKVKTGGDDGDDEGQQAPAKSKAKPKAHDTPLLRHRRDLLRGTETESRLPTDYEFSFDPNSLVGSWFHRLENGEIVWQGTVIGQPQVMVYLVHIERQEPGCVNVQRLVGLEHMVSMDDGYEWRFYDSEAEAREAYAHWTLWQERGAE